MPFLSKLQVELVDQEAAEGRGSWRLIAPLVFESAVAGRTLEVPAGFVTDFESVPRVPIVFDELGDRAAEAAAVHDWLYASHLVDRETADKLLREAAIETGVTVTQAQLIYLGVRVFGASHWD